MRNKSHINFNNQLTTKNSPIDKLASIGADLDINSTEFKIIQKSLTGLVKEECLCYSPSMSDGILCISGEIDSKPLTHKCTSCVLGQFTKKGLFIGDNIQ